MNIANLIIQLQKKMSTATDPLDLLALNKAVNKLKAGSVEVVTYYSNLPDPIANIGKLFYVMTDERLYWSYLNASNVYTWEPIIMTSNSYIWSWGSNTFGQIGDVSTTNKSSPVSTVGNFNDWKVVSTSPVHKLMIRNNGTLWAVGANACGALGDGTTVNKSSPVSVIGGFNDWCQINAASCRSLGLRTNGTIWTWGLNTGGQAGDGTLIDRSSPVLLAGGFTDWQKMDRRTGLRADGTIWAWGGNSQGQLGNNTTVNTSSPTAVVGGFTDWCAIASGLNYTTGLRTNGTAWAWGYNGTGALGDGTTVNKSSPITVVGGFTDWCVLKSRSGIRSNGTLWVWGSNLCGSLGIGTTVNKSSPVSAIGGFTDWYDVANGPTLSLAIRQNRTAWSWGSNIYGQLGDGTTVNKSSPVSVVGGFTNWLSAVPSIEGTQDTSAGITTTSF